MQLAPVPLRETALPFNHQHAFQRLKSHSNYGYSPNTIEKSSVQVKETVSYHVEYLDEFNSSSSVKYPEIYSSPNYSKYLQLGQYEPDFFLMFPLETPNTIPTPATDFKQQQQQQQQQQDQHSSLSTVQLNRELSINTEPNCWLTNKDDFDLDSLLAFPTPANKEQAYFTGDPSWELLGGPEQPILEDMDFINHLEVNLPDEINYWHGFQKDSSYQSDIIKEPKVDPDAFVSNPMMEQDQQLTLGPTDQGHTTYYDISPSPVTPYSCQPAEVSPEAVASLTPDEMQIDTPSSAGGESWGQNLQTLFEKTFDISDLTIPAEDITTSLDNTPCGEKMLHVLSKDSPPLKRQTNEQAEVEMKPQTTLFLGKRGIEIIRKLFSAKSGAPNKSLTRNKLITMPVEDFNTRLEQAKLSEIEVAFMKEWRRRGKNKAAAQTARRRKREEVCSLDQEVYNMHRQKTELEKRCNELQSLVASLTARSKAAEDNLYARQSAIRGKPVSQDTHHIHMTEEDELLLIPRATAKIHVVN